MGGIFTENVHIQMHNYPYLLDNYLKLTIVSHLCSGCTSNSGVVGESYMITIIIVIIIIVAFYKVTKHIYL